MGDMKFYTPKISLFIIMMTVTNVCKGLIAVQPSSCPSHWKPKGVNTNYKGGMDFQFDSTTAHSNVMCTLKIATEPTYRIRYKFTNVYYHCSDLDEMECGNINVFNVFSSENMHIKAQVKDIKQYQDIFQESIGSYIDVVANISTPMVLRARIEFYIVRYSECSTETDEIYCNNVCMHRNIACQSGNTYCSRIPDKCTSSDIVANPFGSGEKTLIFILVVVIVVTVVSLLFLKERITNRMRCKNNRNVDRRSIIRTANEIFTVQLATRGVDSRDGLNSQVLDEEGLPIEMSTFDPPPEYNSLENTYQYIEPSRHSNEDKEDELPPSYKHVIKHTEEYKISTVFGYM
ncbi:uncharacterized protein LOC128207668 [Mya arenaria]|uniref:uncharacterized protein LOC128207668 n=1 Tax=Mya arenaria TaxID=6604 RepID=UPI0022DFDEBD|nr:uncharacterized protein LOC128207668 [Mya arenaria]